jgi:glycosyltransferase involved in cell wall biosynthesis
MKIVQINASVGYGDSTGTTTLEMHNYLISRGFESYVFASKIRHSCDSRNIFKIGNRLGTFLHGFMSRVTGLQGYFSFAATHRIIRLMKKIDPDVVVLRVLHNNDLRIKALFTYFASYNVPVILVLHDCWFYTGHCCYYIGYGCSKYLSGCNKCEHMHDWNNSFFFDTAHKCLVDKKKLYDMQETCRVIAVSDWEKRDAEKAYAFIGKKIQRIYNWMDFEVFYPRNSGKYYLEIKKHNKRIIFSVATSWTKNKGADVLNSVAKEFSDCTVVIVGKIIGKELLKNENVVNFEHVGDSNTMAELYSAADVYINTSRYETFGKTTAEALSCGTPVVIFNNTSGPELVSSERGACVRDGNAPMFIKAISDILEKGKEYYTERCLFFARNNFSLDKNMKEYINLFYELQQEENNA